MNLTRRQEAFMRQLLALYTELQEPIHYSTLAERIGVSRITAYDMLRVLEEKGYAESVYQLTPERSGPGRSTVLYRPTPKANQAISQLVAAANAPDWSSLTEDIIQRMRQGESVDAESIAITAALLERIPPEGPPEIRYCTELITIIVLHLRHSEKKNLLCSYVTDILGAPEQVSAVDLNVLAGVSLGLFMAEKEDEPEWNRELLAHIKRYHQLVTRMDDSQRQLLASTLQDVLLSLRNST
jgi:DNA-binding MarR family transcriptional regulator